MKIHLIKTPEYDYDEYLQVSEFLQSFQGPMEFISTEYEFDKKDFYFLRYELYPEHPFKYPANDKALPYDPDRGTPLSFKELFSLCEYYRQLERISSTDFVILLTNRKNGMNWFSAFDQKNNVFVHTAEWELYTRDVSPKYPVAYEVVANTIQTLMNLDVTTIPNEFIHQPFKACMNDFCQNKQEIIIKLSNARICPGCIDRIRSQNVSDDMLAQVQAIFKGIQSEFDFKVEEKPLSPSKVVVHANGDIELLDYGINLNLPSSWKALYIFFLKHPEGMLFSDLEKNKDELKNLYKICRPRVKDAMLNSTITNLVDADGASFRSAKSRLNTKIQDLLKNPRASFYIIDGIQYNKFSINAASINKLVDIRC